MQHTARNNFRPDDFNNEEIKVSAAQQLELLRLGAAAHEIRFEGPVEQVPSEGGLVYKRFVRVKNGEPIRADGLTPELAEENAAKQIVLKLKDGSIIFNNHKQLEHHKQHENKFSKKNKKR